MNLYSERRITNDAEKRKRAAAEKQAAIKEAIVTGDPQVLMLAYDFGIKEDEVDEEKAKELKKYARLSDRRLIKNVKNNDLVLNGIMIFVGLFFFWMLLVWMGFVDGKYVLLEIIGFLVILKILFSFYRSRDYGDPDYIKQVLNERYIPKFFDNCGTEFDMIDSDKKFFGVKKCLDIFYGCDRLEQSDFVWGTYQDSPFEFTDLEAIEITHNDDGDSLKTTFKGQYIKVLTDNNIGCNLFVRERRGGIKTMRDVKVQTKGNTTIYSVALKLHKEKIATDDPEFNKKYSVYCNDKADALYVLTPQFMKQIEDFSEYIKQTWRTYSGVDMIFQTDGSVIVFIPTRKNLFELRGVKTQDKSSINNMYQRDANRMKDTIARIPFRSGGAMTLSEMQRRLMARW